MHTSIAVSDPIVRMSLNAFPVATDELILADSVENRA